VRFDCHWCETQCKLLRFSQRKNGANFKCAVFDIWVLDQHDQGEFYMKKYEYKTLEMPFKQCMFSREDPDIDRFLNEEGACGWRLHQIILPASSNFGETEKILAILEREIPV